MWIPYFPNKWSAAHNSFHTNLWFLWIFQNTIWNQSFLFPRAQLIISSTCFHEVYRNCHHFGKNRTTLMRIQLKFLALHRFVASTQNAHLLFRWWFGTNCTRSLFECEDSDLWMSIFWMLVKSNWPRWLRILFNAAFSSGFVVVGDSVVAAVVVHWVLSRRLFVIILHI